MQITDVWLRENGFEKLAWGWYRDGFIYRSSAVVKCYPGTKEPHYAIRINITTIDELLAVMEQEK